MLRLQSSMKWSLMTVSTIVLSVGCKSLDNSLIQVAKDGNIEAAKQAIDDGANVNAKDKSGIIFKGATPLAVAKPNSETAKPSANIKN